MLVHFVDIRDGGDPETLPIMTVKKDPNLRPGDEVEIPGGTWIVRAKSAIVDDDMPASYQTIVFYEIEPSLTPRKLS